MLKVGHEKVSILLYADDMVLLAPTENDLQYMLNAMADWAMKWRLKVNVLKSKIVHFRSKRKIGSDYAFKYAADIIERVSSYKYLGIFLDEHLDFSKCSEILAESASRALGGIISKFNMLKDCGYKTYTKLFDSGVLPILNYGAEIWGYGKHPKCDNILNRAMRYFLGVHKYAPTAAVQGDMGWISLKYRRYQAMLRFWNRLVKMDETRLTKRVFLWCYDNPENNWCGDIRKIAETLHKQQIYNTKGIFNIGEIQKKCIELMSIECKNEILMKPKFRIYKEIQNNFVVEPYVTNNVTKYHRSIYAQFRCGILPLHIETGRYANIKDPQTGNYRKLNVTERVCNICKSNDVEDEQHFLLVCDAYREERNTLFEQCSTAHEYFPNLIEIDKFKSILNDNWKAGLKYILESWIKRKEITYL